MDHFHYHDQQLFAEEVPVADIVKRWGTPCYIYSRATLERHWQVFDAALMDHPHLVCYAVKANSNLAVLHTLAKLGAGFDVVSQGELERVLAAQGDPKKIVFSGVAKTGEEIERALEANIFCFNVESVPELYRINEIAKRLNKIAPIALRINPDIDVKTHRYIATGLRENKFGIDYDIAIATYLQAQQFSHLNCIGVACHIGSQILELAPFIMATQRIIELVNQLQEHGFSISHVDLGGGLGVHYHNETPPLPHDYAEALSKVILNKQLKILVEPGRAIAANAGILVTRVEYLKLTNHKNFAIVDAGMNDLVRPALYEAWHNIVPINLATSAPNRNYDIVGPVCETGDFLGKQRDLSIAQEDLLAIRTAGAYGFSMSSNYNSRPRAAEIMVDKNQFHLVRARETYAELFANEMFF